MIKLEQKPENSFQTIKEMVQDLAKISPVECPVTHRFTPGLYARTCFMPKGAIVISKTHNTEHPFVVTKGACRVWDKFNGVQKVEAGHIGITKPGTRRALLILEDTEWTTFHPTTETDLQKIEAAIIIPDSAEKNCEIGADIINKLSEA